MEQSNPCRGKTGLFATNTYTMPSFVMSITKQEQAKCRAILKWKKNNECDTYMEYNTRILG